MSAPDGSSILRVARVIRETADSCSLVLEAAEDDIDRFKYAPGQFLTIQVPLPDGPVARCYSLCSSPHVDDELRIGVKRVAGGGASNYINDSVGPGDPFRALPPAGVFTPKSFDDDLLLLAGGSGITPVLSILKSVLAVGSGHVQLVYANRNEASVMFHEVLAGLQAVHSDRVSVVHWLESLQGIPTRPQLRELLAPMAGRSAFVCGPKPFMEAVTHVLRELSVPPSRVHVERFQSLDIDPFAALEQTPIDQLAAPGGSEEAEVDIIIEGIRRTVSWPRNRVLLEVLLEAGLPAPYSCRQGMCSACACILAAGEVRMLQNRILEPEDLDAGLILACQSLPISDHVSVRYE